MIFFWNCTKEIIKVITVPSELNHPIPRNKPLPASQQVKVNNIEGAFFDGNNSRKLAELLQTLNQIIKEYHIIIEENNKSRQSILNSNGVR